MDKKNLQIENILFFVKETIFKESKILTDYHRLKNCIFNALKNQNSDLHGQKSRKNQKIRAYFSFRATYFYSLIKEGIDNTDNIQNYKVNYYYCMLHAHIFTSLSLIKEGIDSMEKHKEVSEGINNIENSKELSERYDEVFDKIFENYHYHHYYKIFENYLYYHYYH